MVIAMSTAFSHNCSRTVTTKTQYGHNKSQGKTCWNSNKFLVPKYSEHSGSVAQVNNKSKEDKRSYFHKAMVKAQRSLSSSIVYGQSVKQVRYQTRLEGFQGLLHFDNAGQNRDLRALNALNYFVHMATHLGTSFQSTHLFVLHHRQVARHSGSRHELAGKMRPQQVDIMVDLHTRLRPPGIDNASTLSVPYAAPRSRGKFRIHAQAHNTLSLHRVCMHKCNCMPHLKIPRRRLRW